MHTISSSMYVLILEFGLILPAWTHKYEIEFARCCCDYLYVYRVCIQKIPLDNFVVVASCLVPSLAFSFILYTKKKPD